MLPPLGMICPACLPSRIPFPAKCANCECLNSRVQSTPTCRTHEYYSVQEKLPADRSSADQVSRQAIVESFHPDSPALWHRTNGPTCRLGRGMPSMSSELDRVRSTRKSTAGTLMPIPTHSGSEARDENQSNARLLTQSSSLCTLFIARTAWRVQYTSRPYRIKNIQEV
jgi:hypothetical protein